MIYKKHIYIYIYDTDASIQQQADDKTSDLEELQLTKKKKENMFLDTFISELSEPTQIDAMISSTTSSNSRESLRGSRSSAAASSSSAAAATLEEYED